jgi:hypothetical protein
LSVASVFWAANPATGWFAVRKLVLFVIWLLGINLVVCAEHLRRLLQGMFLVSLLTSLVGIGQFVIQYRDARAHHAGEVYHYLTSARIHGFMGHWMHFGGQQMLVFALLLGFLLLSNSVNRPQVDSALVHQDDGEGGETRAADLKSRSALDLAAVPTPSGQAPAGGQDRLVTCHWSLVTRLFWWVVLAFVVISIVLNFTRGVWLGSFLAAVYLLARWKPRLLWALPIVLASAYVGAPSLVRERLHLAMHPTQEPALSIRLEMWRVALRMIRAHPWVGVGPNNIEEVYDLYLPAGKTPEVGYHGHFHNDYLQFGAERGLPCLASWLWLMAALARYTWKLRRGTPPDPAKSGRHAPASHRWIADAAMAAWLAFLAEGFFEFNFGTSPVLMTFLLVTSLPFTAARFIVNEGDPERGRN